MANGQIPRRPLGKTGEDVSVLGVGGFHIGVPEESEGIRIVHEAIDAGVNFLDNAWEYRRRRVRATRSERRSHRGDTASERS